MDALGRDNINWRNATNDNVSVQIIELREKIADIQDKLTDARKLLADCIRNKDERATYSCNKWQGASKSDLQARVSNLEKQLATYNVDLDKLIKIKNDLLTVTQKETLVLSEASIKQSEADVAESIASSEKAKSTGKWAFLGLGVILVGALIYVKIIKKKK